jgi:hypothetical protein
MRTEHPPHFAIVPFSPTSKIDRSTRRRYLIDKYGINPIFYEVQQRIIHSSGNSIPIECYETDLDKCMNAISTSLSPSLPRYIPHVLEDRFFQVPVRQAVSLANDEDLKAMQAAVEQFVKKNK